MNSVVTGASRGIGLELVSQALKRGDRVLAVARDPGASSGLMALQRAYSDSGQLSVAAVDLAGLDVVASADRVVQAAGAWSHVDVLINNAGIYLPGESPEDFRASFHLNAIVPLFVARALFSRLRKAPEPKVVQITSLMGSIGDNESGGSSAYRSSKTALNMLTKTLAMDEPWLTAAVIHPGWVKTRMGGDQAPTTVEDSAAGIWRVAQGLTRKDSGAFFDFEGDRLPW